MKTTQTIATTPTTTETITIVQPFSIRDSFPIASKDVLENNQTSKRNDFELQISQQSKAVPVKSCEP